MTVTNLASLPAEWRKRIDEEEKLNAPEIPQSSDPTVNGNSHTDDPEKQFRHERVVSKMEEGKKLKKSNSVQAFHNYCKVLAGEAETCSKPLIMFREVLSRVRNGKTDTLSAGYKAYYDTHKDLVDRASKVIFKNSKIKLRESSDGQWKLMQVESTKYKSESKSKTILSGRGGNRHKQYEKTYQKNFRTWLEGCLNGDTKIHRYDNYAYYISRAMNYSVNDKYIPEVYRGIIGEYITKLKTEGWVAKKGKVYLENNIASVEPIESKTNYKEFEKWLRLQLFVDQGTRIPNEYLAKLTMSLYYTTQSNVDKHLMAIIDKYKQTIQYYYELDGSLVPKRPYDLAYQQLQLDLNEANRTIKQQDDTIEWTKGTLQEYTERYKKLESKLDKTEQALQDSTYTKSSNKVDLEALTTILKQQKVQEFVIKFN